MMSLTIVFQWTPRLKVEKMERLLRANSGEVHDLSGLRLQTKQCNDLSAANLQEEATWWLALKSALNNSGFMPFMAGVFMVFHYYVIVAMTKGNKVMQTCRWCEGCLDAFVSRRDGRSKCFSCLGFSDEFIEFSQSVDFPSLACLHMPSGASAHAQ